MKSKSNQVLHIVRHHALHFTIVDRSTTPVTRMWQAVVGMAEHHIRHRDPRAECETWLKERGYVQTATEGGWVWESDRNVAGEHNAVQEALKTIERQAIGEDADSGFDGGEFSGPAHADILQELLDQVAAKYAIAPGRLQELLYEAGESQPVDGYEFDSVHGKSANF